MTLEIGYTFPRHGLKGVIHTATVIAISDPKGKRAKVLATIRLDDGTEFKMGPESIPAPIVFAEPATGPMFVKGDRFGYDRNGRIFCA